MSSYSGGHPCRERVSCMRARCLRPNRRSNAFLNPHCHRRVQLRQRSAGWSPAPRKRCVAPLPRGRVRLRGGGLRRAGVAISQPSLSCPYRCAWLHRALRCLVNARSRSQETRAAGEIHSGRYAAWLPGRSGNRDSKPRHAEGGRGSARGPGAAAEELQRVHVLCERGSEQDEGGAARAGVWGCRA